jgi:2-polyprenyl-6-hydroxyphenyl methylase/3-demethylubiquinone-9 3-methyltransferase
MEREMKQAHATTVDASEIARFEAAAADWWDPHGKMRWLHRYNPLRLAYIREAGCEQFQRDPRRLDCLHGLRILDIGCGAGVLCEPLARLSATVVGADPAKTNIQVAKLHAQQTGVDVDYRCQTAEALAADGERFDVVLAMEVLEHVTDSDIFLRRCAELVKPGGIMVLSTISRTIKSLAFAIIVGEYVLQLLPPRTHQWNRFRRPAEVRGMLERTGLVVTNVNGVTWNFLAGALRLTTNTSVAYILTAKRPMSSTALFAG